MSSVRVTLPGTSPLLSVLMPEFEWTLVQSGTPLNVLGGEVLKGGTALQTSWRFRDGPAGSVEVVGWSVDEPDTIITLATMDLEKAVVVGSEG